MAHTLFTLVKLPIKEIILQHYDVHIDKDSEICKEYLVAQENSLLFDQIERLRGRASSHITEVILVVAEKNTRLEKELRFLLTEGFSYNGIHYSRFGKSASQAKEGITAFVCDSMFDELYSISQMDIPVDECVISKYEAQRCLLFSSCTLIPDYMPKIVIIGEYTKKLQNQLIRYMTERTKEYTHPETGEIKTYNAKEIEEGYKDIDLSPFDGCGCHEHEFMEKMSLALSLDYSPIGAQIRMPFMKGYSVYVPFRSILKEWGYEFITDIYGYQHAVSDIDCIWNISMFKGHKLFQSAYGHNAFKMYQCTLQKYNFKLGISKYCHHTSNLPMKTRMNFQYLQCLDLWNPKYVNHFTNKSTDNYDILSPDNEGKIISIAKYTTDLFEKIIQGEPFYTCKFMGITDTAQETQSKYLEAVLTNDIMLKDPAVKQYIYRKLKKSIKEAKLGKIYADGFYHTIIGDMIGYLEYAVHKEPIGCLGPQEFFCETIEKGDCLSFRSPLVCPSEVNKIRLVSNDITKKWFSYFKNQDVVMLNMYDLSLPQQGGADCDGDIVLLCNHPMIVNAKIHKPIVIDINDKTTAAPKPYTQDNIVEYELMTRDSRIGEITNVATSIENKYSTNEEINKLYADYASLLRLFQGHEIDFIKTGTRWHMNKSLRTHMNQLPYFLLFNYPVKMNKYERLREANKKIENADDRCKLGAYHSPSPMNELCNYICTWEKKHILWDNSIQALANTGDLVINHALTLSDRKIMRIVRHCINDYACALRNYMEQLTGSGNKEHNRFIRDALTKQHKQQLADKLMLDEEVIANYVICVSYASLSISKSFAWSGYGDYILKNLRHNSPPQKKRIISEVSSETKDCYEYLGKYYQFVVQET